MIKSIKIFFISCFVLLLSKITAQTNLVPNPSFETLTQCPFSFGLEIYVANWKSARETPDYYNTCATWSGASVPSNNYGYQMAKSGNAYLGMLTYRADSSIYSEAASVQLISPLVIGKKYYISFKISLTLENITESNAANNKIGVQFSTVEYSPASPSPINNYAHIWTDSVISDSSNWSIVKGSFIADSAYTFLSIGNFFDKSFVDTITFGNVFGAYYYFDDVCVSTDSTECYSLLNVINKANDTPFQIFPNPIVDYFTIEQKINEPYDLVIYNTLGQKIFEEKKITEINKTINTLIFEKGILILSIKTKNYFFNSKLIIH